MEETNNNDGIETQEQSPHEYLKQMEKQFSERFVQQEQHLEKLYSSQKELIEAISAQRNPAPQEETPDLTGLLLSDPEKAIKVIKESVKKEINGELDQHQSRIAQQNQTLAQLQQEFPELSDINHPLTKSALEIYGKMSNKEKESPLAYKVAIQEAAMRNNVKPKSVRQQESSDEFSMPSGVKGGPRTKGTDKLDPKTVEFARIMGLNLEDKATVERLKKNASTNLTQYSLVID